MPCTAREIYLLLSRGPFCLLAFLLRMSLTREECLLISFLHHIHLDHDLFSSSGSEVGYTGTMWSPSVYFTMKPSSAVCRGSSYPPSFSAKYRLPSNQQIANNLPRKCVKCKGQMVPAIEHDEHTDGVSINILHFHIFEMAMRAMSSLYGDKIQKNRFICLPNFSVSCF